MYRINTIPGKAAKEKGHATYPDDFPHLLPGEDFTAWKVGDDWEIETTLNGDELQQRLLIFEREKAFSEYYKLATMPCTNPTKADLEPLERATARYETLCEKIEKRES